MSKYRNYLFDLGDIVKRTALEATKERDAAPRGSVDRAFQEGRALAYYEVISLMQQQAESFEIPLADLRLDDINADRDLL